MSPRRRGLLLAGLALLLGTLAASDVAGREAAVDRRLQPLVPVVVARAALPAGARIVARRLAVRQVPARFAPRGALAAPGAAVGLRPRLTIPAGADLPSSALGDAAGGAGAPVRPGERVAEVVAAAAPDAVVAGSRVDVLVTRERDGGHGRTTLALEDVEVLAAAPAPRTGADQAAGARVAASLRVTLRQAVFLTAASSFAREIRLLPRPSGDHGHATAPVSVGDGL